MKLWKMPSAVSQRKLNTKAKANTAFQLYKTNKHPFENNRDREWTVSKVFIQYLCYTISWVIEWKIKKQQKKNSGSKQKDGEVELEASWCDNLKHILYRKLEKCTTK